MRSHGARRLLVLSAFVGLIAVMTACGASGAKVRPTPTPPPASTYLDGSLELRLIAPSQVRQGTAFEGLDVVLTNKGSMARTLYYSGDLLDFVVTDHSGEVWRHISVAPQPLLTLTIGAGESKLLSELPFASQGRWDLRDKEGFPVNADATFDVRGIVNVALTDTVVDSQLAMETPPQTVTVVPWSLPGYAEVLELELTAPTEASLRDAVPMDLRIANKGDSRLVLWWSGGSVIPAPNYLDIVIFKDGQPVWRASTAHDIRHQGTEILEPDEAITLSSLFEGYGDPWFWVPSEAGTYVVRAVANVSPVEVLEKEPPFTPERAAVAAEPRVLTIAP